MKSARPEVRIIPASAAGTLDVKPLFPTSRLLKHAVLEAESFARQAEKHAQQAIDAANREAQEIRQKANADAANSRKHAADEYAAKAAPLLEALDRAIRSHHEQFAASTQRLVFALARQVLSAELKTRPTQLLNILADVVNQAKRYNELLISVHPEDEPIITEQLPKLRPLLATVRDVRVVPDKSLPRHTIRITTEMGHYEDGVQQRLALFEARLSEVDHAAK